jgi:hypothetical protein
VGLFYCWIISIGMTYVGKVGKLVLTELLVIEFFVACIQVNGEGNLCELANLFYCVQSTLIVVLLSPLFKIAW